MIVQPRAVSTDRPYYGVYPGIVAANEENGAGDPQGRVKLRLPWYDPDLVTDWCRVVQPYAGPGFGLYLVPEVGTEVLVSFLFGDFTCPVVLGSLWNGQDKPQEVRGGARDVKVLRTRGGHEIRLDDSAGAAKIEIVSADGSKLTLSPQGIAIETAGTLTLKGATIHLN